MNQKLLMPAITLTLGLLTVLQERIRGVKALFRDKSQTEFIIATIPTQLGINESRRLLGTLREEGIPCKRVIVNQVGRWQGLRLVSFGVQVCCG
jgi:anion-transporting  ArsA/GET3 family ATPase